MIVATASRKASPGATTLAALLAAQWQGSEARLVLEADPSGGSLAARWSIAHGLTWDPGLLNLSTSRVGVGRVDLLDTMAQRVGESMWVSAAPPSPEQVSGALVRLGDPGAAALAASPDIVTFADCGRLSLRSPALPLAARAALTILLCRPRLDEVHTLQPAVAELRSVGCSLGLVCVGDDPYPPEEVAVSLGVHLLGVLPVDVRAMAGFENDGLAAGRAFRRSGLRSSVTELADRVRERAVDLLRPEILQSHDDAVPAGRDEVPMPGTAPTRPGLPPTSGAPVGGGPARPSPERPPLRPQPPHPDSRPRPPHPTARPDHADVGPQRYLPPERPGAPYERPAAAYAAAPTTNGSVQADPGSPELRHG